MPLDAFLAAKVHLMEDFRFDLLADPEMSERLSMFEGDCLIFGVSGSV